MKKNNPFSIYAGIPKSIYILFISRVIDNMGSVVMPMITLILTQKIGLSKNETGILATVFMLTQAPFLLMGGKLVDHMGSKKVIVLFNTLGALAYIPCIFIKPSLAMAALIALAADLFSVAAPAYSSIITELSPESKLKSSYSLLYLGYNLGLVIGPAIGGILFYRHLQLLFLLDAFTCFISTTLVYFLVPNKFVKKQSSIVDIASPLNKFPIFKFLVNSRVLMIFSIVLLVYNFCYSQWGFILPLQSASLFAENGAKFYSLFVSLNAVTVIILTPVLTSLTHKFSPLAILASGGLFYTFSFIIFGNSQVLNPFFVATVFLTIGEILININTNIFIVEQTPQEYIGRANSLLSLINGAGVAVGPVIMGHVLLFLNYRDAWYAVAALMLLGSFSMFTLNRKKYDIMSKGNTGIGK